MQSWRDKIIEWLANGETGLSSETIAFSALGVQFNRASPPYDPADLRRCVILLERAPEAARALPNLASTSDHWRGLVKEWPALVSLLREEIGDDLPPYGWQAPRTHNAMKRAMGV